MFDDGLAGSSSSTRRRLRISAVLSIKRCGSFKRISSRESRRYELPEVMLVEKLSISNRSELVSLAMSSSRIRLGKLGLPRNAKLLRLVSGVVGSLQQDGVLVAEVVLVFSLGWKTSKDLSGNSYWVGRVFNTGKEKLPEVTIPDEQ